MNAALSSHRTLRVAAPGAFDLALTARVLRRSTRNPVDRVEPDGSWSRVALLPHGPTLVRVAQQRGMLICTATPRVADRRALTSLISRVFSLEVELAPFFRRLRREPGFAEVARRCAGLRPQRFASLFEALANGFACQQLSLDSGLFRLGRLAERFGARVADRVGPPLAERVAQAPLSRLRAAGLSQKRAAALRLVARLPLDRLEAELAALSDEEARRRLCELPGVGPWTSDYVLLRGLGRLDIFPAGDVGAARTLGHILGRSITPSHALQLAARFSPQRGMLYFCMLGWTLGVGGDLNGPARSR